MMAAGIDQCSGSGSPRRCSPEQSSLEVLPGSRERRPHSQYLSCVLRWTSFGWFGSFAFEPFSFGAFGAFGSFTFGPFPARTSDENQNDPNANDPNARTARTTRTLDHS